MAKNFPVEVLVTIPLSNELIERLEGVSPYLKFNIKPAATVEEITDEEWAETEILFTNEILPKPSMVPDLRWIQLTCAGVEFVLNSDLAQKKNITFTSLSGAMAPKMAEYTVMMLLALGHDLRSILSAQQEKTWIGWENYTPPQELCGSTVGIVGYGSVGRDLARLLQPFGVTVLAAKRDAMKPHDTGYISPGFGDPEGDYFHRLYPIQALKSMLNECDFVVVCLPLTSSTENLINKEAFMAMKPNAFLVDISRGGIVNEKDLLSALKERHIAGAALDVFEKEPLPKNSPLWQMPNVFVSSHLSSASEHYNERAVDLFIENLKRYLDDSNLLNVVNVQRGY